MTSQGISYYGTYCLLDETSGDSGIKVDGNSWPIGSEVELTPQLHVTERGKEVPRVVVGRKDQAAGFVPQDAFKHLKKAMDENWVCRAFPSAVIFDKTTDKYTVEIALMCYPLEQREAFDVFVERIAERIAKGEHPAVTLSEKERAHVLESNGQWSATKSQELPKLPKGRAYFKTRRTFTEGLALSAASGHYGKLIACILAVVVVIAVILYFVL